MVEASYSCTAFPAQFHGEPIRRALRGIASRGVLLSFMFTYFFSRVCSQNMSLFCLFLIIFFIVRLHVSVQRPVREVRRGGSLEITDGGTWSPEENKSGGVAPLR